MINNLTLMDDLLGLVRKNIDKSIDALLELYTTDKKKISFLRQSDHLGLGQNNQITMSLGTECSTAQAGIYRTLSPD